MPEYTRAVAYADLEEGAIRAVRINGEAIALYKISGQVYATSEMCSHDKCSLEDFGRIVEGDQVECICHGGRFRVKTGAAIRLPAERPLRTYPVKVDRDEIWIELPDRAKA